MPGSGRDYESPRKRRNHEGRDSLFFGLPEPCPDRRSRARRAEERGNARAAAVVVRGGIYFTRTGPRAGGSSGVSGSEQLGAFRAAGGIQPDIRESARDSAALAHVTDLSAGASAVETILKNHPESSVWCSRCRSRFSRRIGARRVRVCCSVSMIAGCGQFWDPAMFSRRSSRKRRRPTSFIRTVASAKVLMRFDGDLRAGSTLDRNAVGAGSLEWPPWCIPRLTLNPSWLKSSKPCVLCPRR